MYVYMCYRYISLEFSYCPIIKIPLLQLILYILGIQVFLIVL